MRGQKLNTTQSAHGSRQRRPTRTAAPRLIGVGVDGTSAGRDAVALGSMLSEATAAELMLISVYEEPLLAAVVPSEVGWATGEKQARAMLVQTRDSLAPQARTRVESDALMWRGLVRVARREHRDLLVLGSSRRAEEGHVGLGNDAADLLSHLECPLAVAPRGMRHASGPRLGRIGVGFDATPESEAALDLAGSIALAAGAELHIRGLVDDRVPGGGRTEDIVLDGDAIVARQLAAVAERARSAAAGIGVRPRIEVMPGSPADGLRELCDHVDLLVIGSGHSGRAGRIYLGRTGQALLNGAPKPVLLTPRPRHAAAV